MSFNIWQGVYKHMDEVSVTEDVFDGDLWIKDQIKIVEAAQEKLKNSGTVPDVFGYGKSLLPFLATVVASESKTVKILDFGGGAGLTYVELLSAGNYSNHKLEYTVVEKEGTCEVGRKVFAGDNRINFIDEIPEDVEVDIIHLGSTLQYIRNWDEYLRKLCRCGAKHILFTSFLAGDVETFATAQNYYGSKIACWIFSIDDVIKVLESEGYELSFKTAFIGRYLGKEQELPQQNLPEKNRLRRSCNLMFSKKVKD